MQRVRLHRRQFLRTATGALAAPWILGGSGEIAAKDSERPRSKNDRVAIGAIGMRYQGTVITEEARRYGDVVAICDLDQQHGEKAREHFGVKAPLYEDYRKLLDRKDIDVVTIATPDHWHTAMVVDACRAGKDVYCEKPLTLTVDEGKHLCRVVRETGRVVQVGTWQRSDRNFRLACELVRGGAIGKVKKVSVVLGTNPAGGPFPTSAPPAYLNWDLWLGQTPRVDYCKERTHFTFRWWYEYSGGQMTDSGAHYMDIAQWGIGMDRSGPVFIDGRAKFPSVENGYNVALSYEVDYRYANGVEMKVRDVGETGVTFHGEKGEIFVNRATVTSKLKDPKEIVEKPSIPREKFRLYAHDNLSRPPRTKKRPSTRNHMGNFFDCIQSRELPISEIVSQHRSVTTCHLGNISMRLGRPLEWDPEKERFVGDAEADGWLRREQRKGFELGTRI